MKAKSMLFPLAILALVTSVSQTVFATPVFRPQSGPLGLVTKGVLG